MLNRTDSVSSTQSESTVTNSVRTVPGATLQSQISHPESISEEDEDRSETQSSRAPRAPPLPPNFTKSNSASRISETGSFASESTTKPKIVPIQTITSKTFQRTTPRRDSSTSESSSQQKRSNPSKKSPTTNTTIQRLVNTKISAQVRGNNNNNNNNNSKLSAFTPQTQSGNSKLSIFEKVDRHNGNATYLGSGTFSQLENCIRNCLAQNTSHDDFHHLSTTSSSQHKSLTRASVLEDYSYEGITAPREQINISTDKLLHHSHSYNDHDYSRHHIKHAADLPLDEIRQVNDALSKYGIPVFSHMNQSNNLYNRPRPVGEVLSVCQQLLNDPLLRSQQTNAIQHVWDNIHNHSPQTYMQGYGTPAVQNVASHLFGNQNQPSYNHGQNTSFNNFNNPPQNSFYPPPPPPPPFPSYQPSSYPPPPPPPPPSGPGNAAQSVLSRLFGR